MMSPSLHARASGEQSCSARRCAAAGVGILTVSLVIGATLSSAAQAQSPSRTATRTPLVLQGAFGSSAGSATDQRGVRSSATTLLAGAALTRGEAWALQGTGSYTQFQAGASSTGGQLGLSAQRDLLPFVQMSLAADGSHTVTSFGQAFSYAAVSPALSLRAGGFVAYGGPRLQYGVTKYTITGLDTAGGILNTPFGPRRVTATQNTQRFTVSAPGYAAGAQLQQGNVALSYRVESTPVPSRRIIDHTVAATLALSRVRLSLSAGQRPAAGTDSGGPQSFTAAQLSWSATRALTLDVSGGRYLDNPVTGTLGGSYLQAGVSWSPARTRVVITPRPVVPRGVASPAKGLTRLSIQAPNAARVAIAGDWNNWQETEARRAGNGVWYIDVPLTRGEYRYAFRVDGAWRVPNGVEQVDDGFGGRSALLTIR